MENKTLSILSIENEVKMLNNIIADKDKALLEKDKIIDKLLKEIELHEKQMSKLIRKNVELSVGILNRGTGRREE